MLGMLIVDDNRWNKMALAIEMSQFCCRKCVAVVCDNDWNNGCVITHN